jgi:hypothetical protein
MVCLVENARAVKNGPMNLPNIVHGTSQSNDPSQNTLKKMTSSAG